MPVTKGKIKKPPFIFTYGIDGVGKSTLMSGAPNVIFFGPENNTDHLDVAREETPTYKDCLKFLKTIIKDKGVYEGDKYSNVAFESGDWFQDILYKHIVNTDSASNMAEARGGWSKAYLEADQMTKEFINLLKELPKIGIGVFVSAHYQQIKVSDPTSSNDYNRYVIKTRDETASYWREAADAVLFAHYEVDKGDKDARAYGDGTRLLGTTWVPAYDAKNRFGIEGTIEMDYEVLMDHINNGKSNRSKEIENEIHSLLEKISNDKTRTQIGNVLKKGMKTKDVPLLEKLLKKAKELSAED